MNLLAWVRTSLSGKAADKARYRDIENHEIRVYSGIMHFFSTEHIEHFESRGWDLSEQRTCSVSTK